MNALTIQIHTLQPLLVTQLGAGEENSATAFHFIPGSVLRGMVINRYLREHQIADAAQNPTCRRLFFDGAVRYLNAYPLSRLGQRTLPKPLSWRVRKEERDDTSATVYDFAIQPHQNLENPVSPSGLFCWKGEGQVEIDTPARYVNVHNASEDRNAKRKDDSTVYRYEAIAAGESFGAVILAEDETDLNILRPFLDGAEIVNLGGSRSAGYGLVRIEIESDQIVPNWREYEPDDEPDNGIVILTLLSDVILRDQYGQPTTNLDAVLGWEHLRAYTQMRVVGGFNRKWGLPLTQALALQAGSMFVYRADQVDLQLLRRLEQQGIGERLAEGFGRIGINWYTQAILQRRSVPSTPRSQAVSLSDESQTLAQRMAGRRLRVILDQKLLEALGQLKIAAPPHNAQLSRLRLVVRRAWREEKPDPVIEHLKNLKAAKEQFERARIGNERLYSWLRDGVQQDRLWKAHLQPAELPSIAGVTAQATDSIKVEYTMRLLDALLKKTLRRERLEGGAA
jgi:CRISPR-associated protein Csx10